MEVLVALAVLEVGLLGAVGLTVAASRVLSRAEAVSYAAAAVQEEVDSLLAVWAERPGGPARSGERSVPGGVVRWTAGRDGTVRVAFLEHGRRSLVLIEVPGLAGSGITLSGVRSPARPGTSPGGAPSGGMP